MKHRYRIMALPVAAALATACLTLKEPVGVHYYLIKPKPVEARSEKQFPFALGVRPFSAPIRYQDEIFYRVSDVEVGYYDYHRWVEPPSDMITGTFADALQAAGLFRRVENIEDAGPSDLVLEGELIGFDEVESQGGRSAYCEVSLRIHWTGKGTPLWTGSFKTAVQVSEEGVSAFARAMSEAVAELTRQAIASLGEADFNKTDPGEEMIKGDIDKETYQR